jgi:ubiquinone/menaquinone biosynthesis C-methylase UbiE
MSTYVLMRILESAPRRYDLGIRLLTLGGLDKSYDRLASHVERGAHVLDLGCGTGALTLRAAQRGAKVKGIDINAQMLEIARQRVNRAGLMETVELVEMGAAELDGEKAARYDVVICGLCLSELNENEVRYTLEEVARILRRGGLLLIADEIKVQGFVKRFIHSLLRAPLAVLAYAITQQTTHPLTNLPQRLINAGFSIISVRMNLLGYFGEFVAQKPAGTAP